MRIPKRALLDILARGLSEGQPIGTLARMTGYKHRYLARLASQFRLRPPLPAPSGELRAMVSDAHKTMLARARKVRRNVARDSAPAKNITG